VARDALCHTDLCVILHAEAVVTGDVAADEGARSVAKEASKVSYMHRTASRSKSADQF